jgi:hypothetical protein
MNSQGITMPTLPPATDTARARPWYREPMLWLVILLPAAAVVAALASVVIAFVTRDAVVADEYRKEGLAINLDPTRDLAAQRLGVGAELSFAAGTVSVRLDPGTAAPPTQLVLLLSHATRAEQDRLVRLTAGPNGSYSAALPALAPGHWYLEVSPADRAWRLTGEFTDVPGTLTLRARTPP